MRTGMRTTPKVASSLSSSWHLGPHSGSQALIPVLILVATSFAVVAAPCCDGDLWNWWHISWCWGNIWGSESTKGEKTPKVKALE